MIGFFSDGFLGTSLLLMLVFASILSFSLKYNYPILSFEAYTNLIVLWFLLLAANYLSSSATLNFAVDDLANNSKMILGLALLACIGIGNSSKLRKFEYFVLILISLLGLSLLTSTNDLFAVYLCLELQTLSFYILASFQKSSAFSAEAGLKYFILGSISSTIMLFGLSCIYGFGGSTNIDSLLNILYISDLVLNKFSIDYSYLIIIQLGFFIYLIGLLFKLGSVPFHIWVSDVYEGAPTEVSAIFSVLPKIAIFTVLIRVLNLIPYSFLNYQYLHLMFFGFAFLSLFLGSILALMQKKIKRLLAFSGVSHVGYALLPLIPGTLDSYNACLFYIIIYILTALFLWGLVLCITNKYGRTLYLNELVDLGKTNLTLGLTASLVIFSLAGIPPLGGFFAKFAVFASTAEISIYLGTVVGLLTSAIGILYYLRMVKLVNFESKNWSRNFSLSKSHSFWIGFAGFFLIFFVFFDNLFSLFSYKIVYSDLMHYYNK